MKPKRYELDYYMGFPVLDIDHVWHDKKFPFAWHVAAFTLDYAVKNNNQHDDHYNAMWEYNRDFVSSQNYGLCSAAEYAIEWADNRVWRMHLSRTAT